MNRAGALDLPQLSSMNLKFHQRMGCSKRRAFAKETAGRFSTSHFRAHTI